MLTWKIFQRCWQKDVHILLYCQIPQRERKLQKLVISWDKGSCIGNMSNSAMLTVANSYDYQKKIRFKQEKIQWPTAVSLYKFPHLKKIVKAFASALKLRLFLSKVQRYNDTAFAIGHRESKYIEEWRMVHIKASEQSINTLPVLM